MPKTWPWHWRFARRWASIAPTALAGMWQAAPDAGALAEWHWQEGGQADSGWSAALRPTIRNRADEIWNLMLCGGFRRPSGGSPCSIAGPIGPSGRGGWARPVPPGHRPTIMCSSAAACTISPGRPARPAWTCGGSSLPRGRSAEEILATLLATGRRHHAGRRAGQHRRTRAGTGASCFKAAATRGNRSVERGSHAARPRRTRKRLMELLTVSIGLGLAVGLLFSELFALAAGGLVVPGYIALSLSHPLDVALTIGVGIASAALRHGAGPMHDSRRQAADGGDDSGRLHPGHDARLAGDRRAAGVRPARSGRIRPR